MQKPSVYVFVCVTSKPLAGVEEMQAAAYPWPALPGGKANPDELQHERLAYSTTTTYIGKPHNINVIGHKLNKL